MDEKSMMNGSTNGLFPQPVANSVTYSNQENVQSYFHVIEENIPNSSVYIDNDYEKVQKNPFKKHKTHHHS